MATKVQSNFNAGLLSHFIEGRPDVAQFYNGLLIAKNIVLLPEGGFENTPGTDLITTTKDNGYALQIGFQPTDETAFEIEMGVGYFRFRKNGVVVLSPLGGELIVNGTFDTDLSGWTDVSIGAATFAWRLGGQAQLNNLGSDIAGGAQQIITLAGVLYHLTFDAIGPKHFTVSVGADGSIDDIIPETLILGASGPQSFTFTATSTVTNIWFRRPDDSSPQTSRFDNVSVLPLSSLPYEISSPYTETDLNEIKGLQGVRESVDVLFICCSGHQPKELVYGGDTNWTLRDSPFDPMPSFEADTDISGGTATLTPAATTGDGINFHASATVFLAGDVGRVIVYGLSRALIVTVTDTDDVVADILVDFPDTDPIPAGQWLLEGSPAGATLNVQFKAPIGRTMSATASLATFRTADVGKFIKTYGGLLEIVKFTSTTVVQVKIRTILADSDLDNPDAAPAGSWTLEIAAWSDDLGWPTLNEFWQGRYCLASNNNQRTTIWMSRTNNFYNFAVGALATDAVEYTHRSGTFGKMKWLKENGALFFGDGFAEHSLKGPGVEQPIGGDTIPFQRPETYNGSLPVRPIHVGRSLLFVDWSGTKILASSFQFEQDAQIAKDSLFLRRDLPIEVPTLVTQGLDNHAPAYIQVPIPLIYWRRSDGVLLVQSFNDDPEGGNNGFTTLELDGEVESYCVTRRERTNVLSLIVKRTINAQTVRYIEEIKRIAMDGRSVWKERQTQATITVTFHNPPEGDLLVDGLDLLEGETVQAVISRPRAAVTRMPWYKGTFVVTGGEITIPDIPPPGGIFYVEVGLPLDIEAKTLRPAIPNAQTDGHLRKWSQCMLRLEKSSLPVVNGTDMALNRSIDTTGQGPYLRRGDFFVNTTDVENATDRKWDTSLDAYVTISRSKPYPVRVLMLTGEVEFSKTMGENTANEGTILIP